jgi:hypothetical protein
MDIPYRREIIAVVRLSATGVIDDVFLTGTLTVAPGGTAVVGVGTLFTTELVLGTMIVIDGYARMVIAIADDLHLTISSIHAPGATAVAASILPDGSVHLDPDGSIYLSSNSRAKRLTVGSEAREDGVIYFCNEDNAFLVSFISSTLTAHRQIVLPDADGTMMLQAVAGKYRLKADGTFQLYNATTAKYHSLTLTGAEGAVEMSFGAGEV